MVAAAAVLGVRRVLREPHRTVLAEAEVEVEAVLTAGAQERVEDIRVELGLSTPVEVVEVAEVPPMARLAPMAVREVAAVQLRSTALIMDLMPVVVVVVLGHHQRALPLVVLEAEVPAVLLTALGHISTMVSGAPPTRVVVVVVVATRRVMAARVVRVLLLFATRHQQPLILIP